VTWFRKKKQAPEDPTDERLLEISLGGFMRQVIYDTLLMDSEGIAEQLGLPPISADVADMEAEASERRISGLDAIMPLIVSHAEISSHAALASLTLQGVEVPAEWTALFRVLSFSSAVSCISTLKELGLIEIGEITYV
jgi:hypothetical protein